MYMQRVVGVVVVQRGQARPQPRAHDDLALGVVDPEPRTDHLDERLVQADRAVRAAVALEPGHVRGRGSRAARRGGATCRCPASPMSSSDWPRPASRSSAAPRRCAASASLPTSGDCVWSRPVVLRRRTRQADTGAARPLSASSPIGSSTKRGISRWAVVSPVTIVPGAAAAWSRAATFVISPSATACGVAGPDHADSREPAVDPDADVELLDLPGLANVAPVRPHHLEHREPRLGGAVGVVLVRGRDTEIRAHAVAHVCLHRPAELLDDAAHPRHALADERLHLVGAHALAQPGGADDVREERGHRPKLVTPAGPALVDRIGWL